MTLAYSLQVAGNYGQVLYDIGSLDDFGRQGITAETYDEALSLSWGDWLPYMGELIGPSKASRPRYGPEASGAGAHHSGACQRSCGFKASSLP